MKQNKERGAIVMEATIALTTFIFLIFTLLMIVNIYYIQSKISVALNTAAREVSEYSYLYFKLGINDVDSAMSEGTDESRGSAKQTIDSIAAMSNAASGLKDSAGSLDFGGMMDNLNAGIDAGSSVYNQYSEQISSDPAGLIKGMALMAADELVEEGKAYLAEIMAKAFMKKNLVASGDDNADAFLKRYFVVKGLDGLDFNYTTFLPGGKSSYIQLVVSYDVQVVKLLNIDFKFHFRQAAMTNAWATGVSLIHKETNVSSVSDAVWDYGSSSSRAAYIRNQERKEYPYIATDQGFDAYNNNEDKNEFVRIISVDTGKDGEADADALTDAINAAYAGMKDKVEKLGEDITVQDHQGKDHEMKSDPNSRTYKVVLVVPDDAPEDAVNQAIENAKKNNPDLEVEVHRGYGSHASEEGDGDDSGDSDDSGESDGDE